MLVSVNVEHRHAFAGLRAIVLDEVHSFAGDDRGWHLLAVVERLTRVAGRPIRIGLSATVGNDSVVPDAVPAPRGTVCSPGLQTSSAGGRRSATAGVCRMPLIRTRRPQVSRSPPDSRACRIPLIIGYSSAGRAV